MHFDLNSGYVVHPQYCKDQIVDYTKKHPFTHLSFVCMLFDLSLRVTGNTLSLQNVYSNGISLYIDKTSHHVDEHWIVLHHFITQVNTALCFMSCWIVLHHFITQMDIALFKGYQTYLDCSEYRLMAPTTSSSVTF